MTLETPDVIAAVNFLDSQLKYNPQKVRAEYQPYVTHDAECRDINDNIIDCRSAGVVHKIVRDMGRGWTNAVDVIDNFTGEKYQKENILGRILVKTDIEYNSALTWEAREWTTKSCGDDCTGYCCCTETPGAWTLGETPGGGGKFVDVVDWSLDSEDQCDPINYTLGDCERNCNRHDPGCRGKEQNNKTFGDRKTLNYKCLCKACIHDVRNSVALNNNSKFPREYEAVRVYNKSADGIIDHELLGVSNKSNPRYMQYTLASFRIEHKDPQYNKDGGGDPGQNPGGVGLNQGYRLQQRSWMYDVSLGVFSYVLVGKQFTAAKLLRRAFLEQETSSVDVVTGVTGRLHTFLGGFTQISDDEVSFFQGQGYNVVTETELPGNPDPGFYIKDVIFRPTGSIPFSFDQFIGLEFTPPYFRTGSNAWLGSAACYYMIKTGDTTFLQNVVLLADWMLKLQVTSPSDTRYGLFTGGEGSFGGDAYIFTSGRRTWCSSEHNFDCHMFYRYMFILTLDEKYKTAYKLVEEGLMKRAYIPEEGRFAQGVRLPNQGTAGGSLGSFQDQAYALDMWTWGGLFLSSIQQWGKAKIAYDNAFGPFYRENQTIPITVPENQTTELTIEQARSYNRVYKGKQNERFSGFSTYFDSSIPGPFYNGDPTYLNAPTNIWPEGTWGAIMLGDRLGEDTASLKDSMARMQKVEHMGGTMPAYTTGYSQLPYEQQVWPAVNPASWLIVSELDPNYSVFPIGFAAYNGVLELDQDGNTAGKAIPYFKSTDMGKLTVNSHLFS